MPCPSTCPSQLSVSLPVISNFIALAFTVHGVSVGEDPCDKLSCHISATLYPSLFEVHYNIQPSGADVGRYSIPVNLFPALEDVSSVDFLLVAKDASGSICPTSMQTVLVDRVAPSASWNVSVTDFNAVVVHIRFSELVSPTVQTLHSPGRF